MMNTHSKEEEKAQRPLEFSKGSITAIQIGGVLFVIIFTIILISNISISNSLKDDSSAINLAGRQRMLSQRLTKSLNNLRIAKIEEDKKAAIEASKEVALAYNLFGTTLAAFRDGGETIGAAGAAVNLNQIKDKDLRLHVMSAVKIWDPLSKEIEAVTSVPPAEIDDTLLDNTYSHLSSTNLDLLKLMNLLTVGLEGQANAKSSKQQVILWIALILVFATFSYIVLYALRSLKKRDAQLQHTAINLQNNFAALQKTNNALEITQSELNGSNDSLQEALNSVNQISDQAQKRAEELEVISGDLSRMQEESDAIFNSVDHGLCLLDNKFKIGSRISLATYDIFETEHLSGMSFVDLMRPLITERDLKTLDSFLKLQFNKKTLKAQLEKYNPLKKVEITLNWDGNKFKNKHLGFDFERVMDGEDIVGILVTVTDITETVALENKLKKASSEQARKTDLILEILASDSTELELFLSKTEKELDQINGLLKEQGVSENSKDSGKELIEDVFRIVHNIKGNSSMLGLETVSNIAHAVEENLAGLRVKKTIKGEEFLSSIVQLATLRERLSDYEEIVHTILKDFSSSDLKKTATKQKVLSQSDKLALELEKFSSEVAADLGKKVFTRSKLDVEHFSSDGISTLKDVLIQIIRNSLVHGIEKPEDRKKRRKSEEGLISLTGELDDTNDNIIGKPAYSLTFRDDGNGLNIQQIRESALAKGFKTKSELASLSDAQVASFIFEPSFSTLDTATKHGGRGAGMSIIKEKIVNELGGKLSMSFAKGGYMQLACVVPQKALLSNNTKTKSA